MKLLLTILSVLLVGCSVTPQQRMKDCNTQANELKGDARKAFMKECLKA